MSRAALVAVLSLVPAVAAAVPKSPGIIKRVVGAYTDRVHPFEVRGALALASSMTHPQRSDEVLVNRVKQSAPKISLWSLRRMMVEMRTTNAQAEAAMHYIDATFGALSPKEALAVAGAVQTHYPDNLIGLTKELSFGPSRRTLEQPTVHLSLRAQRAAYQQKVNELEAATAIYHDQIIERYVANRRTGITTVELAVLAKGAKLEKTRVALEQAAVALTR